MQFFGVGASEAILVLVLALIVVGPSRFPEIARSGGRWYRIARRFTAEVTKDLRSAVDEIDSEIRSETGDLRSIRDLSKEIESDLNATGREIEAAAAVPSREPTPLTSAATADTPPPDPESTAASVEAEAKVAEQAASGEEREPSTARNSADDA